tara:strand:- start:1 stop:243 length:243 start_codon:yes stop_codon:yes gene_type:complete
MSTTTRKREPTPRQRAWYAALRACSAKFKGKPNASPYYIIKKEKKKKKKKRRLRERPATPKKRRRKKSRYDVRRSDSPTF